MGVQAAAVTVFDQDYKLIYPETLQLVSTGIIKVTFPEPRQGFVSVTFGQSSSGSAGSAGSTGSTGSTGSAGSTGSTGSAGSTGSTGSTGSAGSTGSSGTSGRDGGTFQHTQTTPSRRWAVNHNLNMRPIVFSATNFSYQVINPETVSYVDDNNVILVFAEEQTGYVTVTFGSSDFGNLNADIIPDGDNTRALGSSAKRFTTLHSAALNTGDIIMKNDNGHFTIDEQNEYLRVYNHSNGKYYKLLMEEIEN